VVSSIAQSMRVRVSLDALFAESSGPSSVHTR
jgi:hypothetical protein